MARLLVYVYRAYTWTTLTVQAFNYARASRRTTDLEADPTYVHLNTVSWHFGAETKKCCQLAISFWGCFFFKIRGNEGWKESLKNF